MFKLGITNIKQVKSIIKGLNELTDTIQVKITGKKVEITAQDKGQTAHISIQMNKFYFKSYFAPKEEIINLDLNLLKNILRNVKNDEEIKIIGDRNQVIMDIKGESDKRFWIRTLKPEYQKQKTPINVEMEEKILIPLKIFTTLIKDVETISDTVKINLNNKTLKIESTNENIELKHKYQYRIPVKREIENRYNIERILNFLKIDKITDEIRIKMEREKPLVLLLENLNIQAKLII